MNTLRIVAAVTAAALSLSSGGVFAQAERNQELLDQAQRDAQRGYPRGDPRSGDARTPGDVRGPTTAPRVQQPVDNRGPGNAAIVETPRGSTRVEAPRGGARIEPPRDGNRLDPRTTYRTDDRGRVVDPRGTYRSDDRVYGRGDGRGYERGYERFDDRVYGRGDGRGYERRDDREYGYRADHWRHDGRGAGPDQAFYRGGRLPYEYRTRQYVVDDWYGHRLYSPPRGYQWVQTGGDYVLVAVATGIIVAILLNQ